MQRLALLLIISSTSLSGCGWGIYQLVKEIQDAVEEGDEQLPSTASAVEAAKQYAIALGGVAPGRDELVIVGDDGTATDFSGRTLTLTSDNEKIAGLLPRPGFDSFAAGGGAQMVPQSPGTTAVHYDVDGVRRDEVFGVTVPPQTLVQILIGEARGLLKSEADIKDGVVQLSSRSKTGDAIAAVIRNRIVLINADKNPALFGADTVAYYIFPPASSYDAVIEAASGGVYQFSPLDPADTSHDEYQNGEARKFLEPKFQLAYDQAVLTAAAIYDGRTDDPTGGAFAFRSPTVAEAVCLDLALNEKAAEIPPGCGPGNDNFPAFSPVQILIHPDVGKQSDGRAAFVFYRKRTGGAPAVTNVP